MATKQYIIRTGEKPLIFSEKKDRRLQFGKDAKKITIHMSPGLIAAVEAVTEQQGRPRAKTIRALIRAGIGTYRQTRVLNYGENS